MRLALKFKTLKFAPYNVQIKTNIIIRKTMLEKLIYVTIISLLIYANYVVIHLTMIDYKSKKDPAYKANSSTAITFDHVYVDKDKRTSEKTCCNPLICKLNGKWILKENIGFKELNNVLDTNMKLRMRKGWPTNLYHGDLRCGSKYPLPRIIRINNSEVFYTDIASQCDSLSNAPCCRDDIGWCGRGDWFCNCNTCTNYETLIHSELYEWKTNSTSCNIKTIGKEEACNFLKSTYSSITFIGDSLVRHTFSALLLKLTGDKTYGALKADMNAKNKDYCKGENQFVDSSCHTKLALKWEEVNKNNLYCSSNPTKIKVSFIQAYKTALHPLAEKVVKEALEEDPRPLILFGIGVHDNFNSSKIISNYIKPILNLKKIYNQSNPLFIWLNTHSAGPLKPMTFHETQGNKKILKFNEELHQFCNNNSILVFETFNITTGVHSFDGTHYGSAINMLKIELLLHGLYDLENKN